MKVLFLYTWEIFFWLTSLADRSAEGITTLDTYHLSFQYIVVLQIGCTFSYLTYFSFRKENFLVCSLKIM